MLPTEMIYVHRIGKFTTRNFTAGKTSQEIAFEEIRAERFISIYAKDALCFQSVYSSATISGLENDLRQDGVNTIEAHAHSRPQFMSSRPICMLTVSKATTEELETYKR